MASGSNRRAQAGSPSSLPPDIRGADEDVGSMGRGKYSYAKSLMAMRTENDPNRTRQGTPSGPISDPFTPLQESVTAGSPTTQGQYPMDGQPAMDMPAADRRLSPWYAMLFNQRT